MVLVIKIPVKHIKNGLLRLKKIFTKNKKIANNKKIMFCKCLNSLIVFILFLLSLFVNKTKRGISIPKLDYKKTKEDSDKNNAKLPTSFKPYK